MKKRTLYSELAYVFGLLILAVGAALMTQADLGVSMVVAPAYLLHLKLSEFWPFFSFGMAEYTLQGALLLVMMLLVRKCKLSYLFSLVTAVLYGLILDGALAGLSLVPLNAVWFRLLCYVVGLPLTGMGVSLLFQTYLSPEAYELFVKEVSARFHVDLYKFKTAYDCASCAVAILLSFLFFGFGHFEGVKIGTIICAVLNGYIIRLFTKLFERHFTFRDRLAWRKYF